MGLAPRRATSSQIKAVAARLGTLWQNYLPGAPGSDEGAL